jgi:hypothetical protein
MFEVLALIAMPITGCVVAYKACGWDDMPLYWAGTFIAGTVFAWFVWILYALKFFGWLLKVGGTALQDKLR